MIRANLLHDSNEQFTTPVAIPITCENWHPATSRMPLSPQRLVPAGTSDCQDRQRGALLQNNLAMPSVRVAGNGRTPQNGRLQKNNHITRHRQSRVSVTGRASKGQQQRLVSRLHPAATEKDLKNMGMALADALADVLVPSSPREAPSITISSPSPYESKTRPADICQSSRYSVTDIKGAHLLLWLAASESTGEKKALKCSMECGMNPAGAQ